MSIPEALYSSLPTVSDSQVTVQITAPLKDVEEWLNRDIPEVLHSSGPRKEVLIPKERKSIKVPKIKKFKTYWETKYIDVSPEISGDVTENLIRQGPLRLSLTDGTLVATQTICAHATARGRGAIGKNIHQSVDGVAIVTARLSASIAPDWTLQGHLDISHSWQKPPTANLFGKIPVTLTTEVDKLIAKYKEDFEARLPTILENSGLRLRRKMEGFWAKIQEPIVLSIKNAEIKLYLHVLPESVSMSELDLSGDTAKVSLGINAQTAVRSDRNATWERPSPLPNLTILEPNARGFELGLPLTADGNTLSALAAAQLPMDFPAEQFGAKEAQIVGLNFSFADEKVLVTAQIKAEYSNVAAPTEKTVKFLAVPQFSSSTQTVTLADIMFVGWLDSSLQSTTNLLQSIGAVSDEFSLGGGANWSMPMLNFLQSSGFFSEQFSFSITKWVEQAEMKAVQSLKEAEFDGVKTASDFSIDILDMAIRGKVMEINAKMVGTLGIELGL